MKWILQTLQCIIPYVGTYVHTWTCLDLPGINCHADVGSITWLQAAAGGQELLELPTNRTFERALRTYGS